MTPNWQPSSTARQLPCPRHPPDLVALSHKDTREYGVAFFGQGYGQQLYGWVEANYRPIALFGDPPLQPGSRFGIRLLERRPTPSP